MRRLRSRLAAAPMAAASCTEAAAQLRRVRATLRYPTPAAGITLRSTENHRIARPMNKLAAFAESRAAPTSAIDLPDIKVSAREIFGSTPT